MLDALSTKFKDESLIAYDDYCVRMGEKILNEPKQFYKFVEVKRKLKGYPAVMHLNNDTSSNNLDISNFFKCNLQEAYIPVSNAEINLNDFDYLNFKPDLISDIQLGRDEIFAALSQLKIDKGPGPDQIPPSFLTNCAYNLSEPLYHIFNQSLLMGEFPDKWKYSFLTPVHKNGSRNDVKNYRGIAILSSIPKLFEKLLCDKITPKISPLLNDEQHGFLKNRSTQTNLTIFSSSVIKSMECGLQTDAIYTDFSKAFDRVSHRLLFLKLERFGIRGNLLNWLKSYLINRKQKVRFQGSLSDEILVTSGVPQGSHLGPLLFNIFISDLSYVLHGINHLFYADDLKIFHVIKNPEDATFLQSYLQRLDNWCKSNEINLNIAKCSVISFHRKNNSVQYNYTIDNKVLSRSMKIRDLGVVLDSKLNFIQHYETIIAKAKSSLGFIKRRSSEFKNVWVTKTLYCSFVRSILEYCSFIWMPFRLNHIQDIESIQKQFLLFALRQMYDPRDYDNLPSYTTRLKLLDLKSLEGRRELLACCFIFDILKKGVNIKFLNDHVLLNNDVRPTRHSKLLKQITHRTDYGKNEPINRGVSLFNKHSSNFNNTICKFSFKNKIINEII